MHVLGIDIGGSAVKGAVVDAAGGRLETEALSLDMPQGAEPEAVLDVVAELVRSFCWTGPIGCGFPAVIDNGVARTASNIDRTWIGYDVAKGLSRTTGCCCRVINDADAAGVAEMRYGAGRGCSGTVLMVTLGTGIGSALFHDRQLFPNLELGLLPYRGEPIERYASAAVRHGKKLGWKKWAGRLNRFFDHAESILFPERIIVGGGVSRNHQRFFPYLDTRAELVPARFFNRAGIIGAASHAAAPAPTDRAR